MSLVNLLKFAVSLLLPNAVKSANLTETKRYEYLQQML